MNYELFIARRYLFAKKSHHAINIISGISVLGVAVATMAMVVTLSVFNGFQDLVADLFTAFDAELRVTPADGQTVSIKWSSRRAMPWKSIRQSSKDRHSWCRTDGSRS